MTPLLSHSGSGCATGSPTSSRLGCCSLPASSVSDCYYHYTSSVSLNQRCCLGWLVECCFTSTETAGLLGTGAQDGHLNFHTALELSIAVFCCCRLLLLFSVAVAVVVVDFHTSPELSITVFCRCFLLLSCSRYTYTCIILHKKCHALYNRCLVQVVVYDGFADWCTGCSIDRATTRHCSRVNTTRLQLQAAVVSIPCAPSDLYFSTRSAACQLSFQLLQLVGGWRCFRWFCCYFLPVCSHCLSQTSLSESPNPQSVSAAPYHRTAAHSLLSRRGRI